MGKVVGPPVFAGALALKHAEGKSSSSYLTRAMDEVV